MLKLVKETDNQIVPYDEGVVEGKKIMTEIEDRNWRLGDLANHVEPKYGENTLVRFAQDIGVPFNTLRNWRKIVKAWQEYDRPRSFCIAADLVTLPNRAEIVRDNPNISSSAARKLAKEYRAAAVKGEQEEEEVFPYQEPCTNCNTAQEQWQRSLGNMLGDILSFRSYWTHLFGPEWEQYKIPSSHLKLAAQAKKEFISLVAGLKEHPRDEEN